MARIPQYTSRERLTTDSPNIRKDPTAEAQASVGGALEDIGGVMQNISDQILKVSTANATSKSNIEVLQSMAAIEDEVDKNPDLDHALDGIDEKLSSVRDKTSKNFVDPTAREEYLRQYELKAAEFNIKLKAKIMKKQVALARVNSLRDLELLKSNYINSATDKEKNAVASKIDQYIKSRVALNIFGAEEGNKLKKSTIKGGEEGIKDGKDLEAKRRKEIQLAREYAEGKRESELIDMYEDGKTPPEDLMRITKEDVENELVSPEVATALINSVKSPKTVGAKTDPEAYMRMVDMITDPDGDAKKTRAELLATNARGDLSVTDFKSLYKTKLAGNNFSLAKMYQTVLAEENKEKGINYFSVAVDVVKEFFTSMDSTYDIVKRVFKRANEENIPSEKIPDIAKEEINNQLQAENPKYTLEDLEFTATESGMTIEEVLKALRTKEGR